jgi:small subunit ribosomal protein S24e
MSMVMNYEVLETEVVVLKEYDNRLMQRKELKIILKGAAGILNKADAIQLIAKKNGSDASKVIPINMNCSQGNNDIEAKFHIYQSDDAIKQIVPRFRNLRILPKAERKKIIDDEKAAKIKAKQALLEKSKPGK